MTTAEACTEAWRVHPSRVRAISHSSRTDAWLRTISASGSDFWWASSSVMFSGKFGTSFAIRSTSPYGMPRTRPTSRIAAFAPSVPNVMM